jgi:hypothetical protein
MRVKGESERGEEEKEIKVKNKEAKLPKEEIRFE